MDADPVGFLFQDSQPHCARDSGVADIWARVVGLSRIGECMSRNAKRAELVLKPLLFFTLAWIGPSVE
jgi:hypothetical protein